MVSKPTAEKSNGETQEDERLQLIEKDLKSLDEKYSIQRVDIGRCVLFRVYSEDNIITQTAIETVVVNHARLISVTINRTTKKPFGLFELDSE